MAAGERPKAAQASPLGVGGRGKGEALRLVLERDVASGAGERNLVGDCYRCC